MNIDTQEKDGVFIMYIKGEVDINSSPDLKKELDKVKDAKKNNILLNCQDMLYIDSSGLATVVDFFKSIKAYNGKLMFCELSENIKKLFAITRLDKLFKMISTEEEAIKAF